MPVEVLTLPVIFQQPMAVTEVNLARYAVHELLLPILLPPKSSWPSVSGRIADLHTIPFPLPIGQPADRLDSIRLPHAPTHRNPL